TLFLFASLLPLFLLPNSPARTYRLLRAGKFSQRDSFGTTKSICVRGHNQHNETTMDTMNLFYSFSLYLLAPSFPLTPIPNSCFTHNWSRISPLSVIVPSHAIVHFCVTLTKNINHESSSNGFRLILSFSHRLRTGRTATPGCCFFRQWRY